jgi:hypothetical protein
MAPASCIERALDLVEQRSVDDGGMLCLVELALVANETEIGLVPQQVIESATAERCASDNPA